MTARIAYPRWVPDVPQRRIPYRSVPPPRVLLGLRWLRLKAGPGRLEPDLAVEAMAALRGVGGPLGLGIQVSNVAIEVGVLCHAAQAAFVERAVRGVAQEWSVEVVEFVPSAQAPLQLVCPLEQPEQPDWAPLRDLRSFEAVDPLASILEAVQPFHAGEGLMLLLLVRPADPARRQQAHRAITVPYPPQTLGDLIALARGKAARMGRFEPRWQRVLEDRLGEAVFEVQGAAWLAGDAPARLTSRASSLAHALDSRFDAGFGGIALESPRWSAGLAGLSSLSWREEEPSLLLTPGEVAAVWHVPSERVLVPGIQRLRRPPVPLPVPVMQAQGLLLGTHRQRGQEVPVRLTIADLQAGHAAIVGRTGVGKSTLAYHLLRQLMGS